MPAGALRPKPRSALGPAADRLRPAVHAAGPAGGGRGVRRQHRRPGTLVAQVDKLRQRFRLSRVVLVGDRGMITAAGIREPAGLDWIPCLRAPQSRPWRPMEGRCSCRRSTSATSLRSTATHRRLRHRPRGRRRHRPPQGRQALLLHDHRHRLLLRAQPGRHRGRGQARWPLRNDKRRCKAKYNKLYNGTNYGLSAQISSREIGCFFPEQKFDMESSTW